MSVTLRDVADACGVNISTVSRSLNGRYGVDAETRRRVVETAEKLNYRRNRMASGLVTGKSHTFALIVSDVRNPFFAELARAVENAAYRLGYDLILCNSDYDAEKQSHYFRSLTEKMVDGVIFSVFAPFDDEQQIAIIKSGIPTLLLTHLPGVHSFSTLTSDYFGGGVMVGDYLLRLKHRRIAHLTGSKQHGNLAARCDGFLTALRNSPEGIEPLILRGQPTYRGGFEMTMLLMAKAPDTTAIFSASDTMACGTLQALGQLGKRVPEDVSLVGFDDIELAGIIRPPLTTVHVPIVEKGVIAVEMLSRLASTTGAEPEHRLMDVHLVERESCRSLE